MPLRVGSRERAMTAFLVIVSPGLTPCHRSEPSAIASLQVPASELWKVLSQGQ